MALTRRVVARKTTYKANLEGADLARAQLNDARLDGARVRHA